MSFNFPGKFNYNISSIFHENLDKIRYSSSVLDVLLILSPRDIAYKIGHIYPLYSKQI